MFNSLTLVWALTILHCAQAVQFLGRVNPANLQLTWPGTGVAFKFRGTQAVINFSQVIGNNSLDIFVDNAAPIVVPNVSTNNVSIPVSQGGTHSVVVRRRSETAFGTITFENITATRVTGPGSRPARRIEYVGDSITVGYGEDGTFPCTNTAALEDAPETYGALTAGNLSAAYSLIAWSGKGLYRNVATTYPDTSPTMPVLWTRYGANDANNSYTFPKDETPQAVVINLGTNDFSYAGIRSPPNITTYEQTYVTFIQTIQSHYPEANFFLCSSPMLSDYYPTTADMQHTTQVNAIENVIATLNSTKMHFVNFPTQNTTEDNIGCDYHPGPTEHETMAAILIPIIQEALNW